MQENIVELMAYCVTDALAQAIMDLPFVPFFFLSLATSPWRLFPWLAGALAGADISYDD